MQTLTSIYTYGLQTYGHDELEADHNLPWFDRRDKDFKTLQKVTLEPKLLESFMFNLSG